MRNILQDFDPIKDANWNMEPFHSDYVVPKRKSRIVDPYEMMPVYPRFDDNPEDGPRKPKTRALTGNVNTGYSRRRYAFHGTTIRD
jgi:hypothetical protein